MRIDQRTEVVKAIRGDKAGSDQFPQPSLDFAGKKSGCANQVGKETGAALDKSATQTLRDDTQTAERIGPCAFRR